jgi:DNA polymerase III epsilon subunit-like protein
VKVIFLDTEYSSATEELAQLSYVLMDGETRASKNFFFRVREMDEGSLRVHGLTKEWLDENGVEPERARAEVLYDFAASVLVAHNLNSDKRILEKAFGPLPNRYGLCTMYRFARVLQLPGGRPYKNPSLRELMAHYGVEDESVRARALADFQCDSAAHDARYDAEAVCLCALAAMARGDIRNLLTGEK